MSAILFLVHRLTGLTVWTKIARGVGLSLGRYQHSASLYITSSQEQHCRMGGTFSSVNEDGTDLMDVMDPIGTTIAQMGELGQIGIVWFSIGVAVWQLLLIAKNLMVAGKHSPHLTLNYYQSRFINSRLLSTERFDRQIYAGRGKDQTGVWEHQIYDRDGLLVYQVH